MSVAGEFWLFRSVDAIDRSGANLLREIRSRVAERGAQFVRVGTYTDPRSLPQNALSHVWYGEIGRQDGEYSTVRARRFCKLHFGVPIKRATDEQFRLFWDTHIKQRLTTEEKEEAMDFVAVTSTMNKAQMTEYLTEVQAHFAQRGVILTGLEDGR